MEHVEGQQYSIYLGSAVIERLKSLCVPGSGPAQWIEKAVEMALSLNDKRAFERQTVEHLAMRYSEDPVRTDADLVRLFERATKLGPRDIVLHLDETEAQPLEELAKLSKMALADTVRKYFMYDLAMGWFEQPIYQQVIVLTDQEAERLRQLARAKGRMSGKDIVAFCEQVTKRLAAWEEVQRGI